MPSQLFSYPLYSGDVIPLTLNFYQADGTTPMNLTGITVGATVKSVITTPDSGAVYWKDIPGDSTGVIAFSIPGLAAGTFWLDIKWWNTTLNNARQTVIGATQLVIQQSVTSRTVPGGVTFDITGIPLPRAA